MERGIYPAGPFSLKTAVGTEANEGNEGNEGNEALDAMKPGGAAPPFTQEVNRNETANCFWLPYLGCLCLLL
jgi:hypothetical protein